MARFSRFNSRYSKFQTSCPCGRTTTKAHARANGGKCKTCVTGVAQPTARSYPRSYDDIAREGGYEDTMGISPEALESYRSGGY
jgi:hypothetical protein